MAEVVQFASFPDRWPKDRPGLRKRGGPWRAIDLKGKRPQGHRAPAYGPAGKVLIATGQVWVERHTQRLFVITDLIEVRDTFYPYDVIFLPYKQKKPSRRLAETTFRGDMQIWDLFDKGLHPLVEKVRSMAHEDPGSPWQNAPDAGRHAMSFFGLDREGYRID